MYCRLIKLSRTLTEKQDPFVTLSRMGTEAASVGIEMLILGLIENLEGSGKGWGNEGVERK